MDIKQLANGQLPSSIGDLYTSPTDQHGTIVNSITCVNTHTATITINLYLLPIGGTARRIIPKNLSLDAGDCGLEDAPITLDAGDKIRGDASTADKIDYTIGGIENP